MDATSGSGKAEASDPSEKPPEDLPNVESPSLAPGQSEASKHASNNTEPGVVSGHKVSTAIAIYKSARADAPPDLDPVPSLFNRLRSRAHVPPLAAAVVLTLGVGVLAGSLGMIGVGQLFDAPKDTQSRETALKDTVAQLSADIGALKVQQAAAVKTASSQLTRLSERLDKAERTQAETGVKVAKSADTVNQLERRAAIAPATVPAASAPVAPSARIGNQADVTGSIPGSIPMPRAAPIKDASRLPVIQGWVLQRVVDGTAIIYSREGMIEVGVGAALPGGGRVEDIRRQDGRWIVVTSRGLVTMR
jgi:hypothetical protein